MDTSIVAPGYIICRVCLEITTPWEPQRSTCAPCNTRIREERHKRYVQRTKEGRKKKLTLQQQANAEGKCLCGNPLASSTLCMECLKKHAEVLKARREKRNSNSPPKHTPLEAS